MVRRLRGVLQGPILAPLLVLAQGLADVQPRAREVDVGDAQAEEFAAAQSRGEVEREGHVETAFAAAHVAPVRFAVARSRGCEQRGLLGRRVDVEGRRLVVGELDVLERVLGDEALGDRRFIAAPTKTRCLRTVLAKGRWRAASSSSWRRPWG